MRKLSMRPFALEAQAGEPGETFYLFQMPDEESAAALTRMFGTADAPPGATVTLFSRLPVQGLPQ